MTEPVWCSLCVPYNSRARGKDWSSVIMCRKLWAIPLWQQDWESPATCFFLWHLKTLKSMWLACPKKGFAFLSLRACAGHFLSLILLPFSMREVMAGKDWAAEPVVKACLQPHCPLFDWGLGQPGRRVCACSMCWNVWVLWHTLPRNVQQTHELQWVWGSHSVDFCKWLKTWEGISWCWKFRLCFLPLKCNCFYPL